MQANPIKGQNHQFFIGIMSGTSMDGIDGALCTIDENGKSEILVHTSSSFSTSLKELLTELQAPCENELHKEALAANQLAREYADIVARILKLASLQPEQIIAIGAHGQTIRHQPLMHDGIGYSLQCLNGSLLAELTHIDVINDFRSRDIAASGQGAPLVPGFHLAQFGKSQHPKAILNLGGIANLTLLHPDRPVLGFDTGPGNVLLDEWIYENQQLRFDHEGMWARSGQLQSDFVDLLMQEAYFSHPIPKSTGRDLFNLSWLKHKVTFSQLQLKAEDVQASLVELTARTIVKELFQYLPDCLELIVCGGGSKNHYLLEQINLHCGVLQPSMNVITTQELGLDPQTIEAMAFAWLAWCFYHRQSSNIAEVTGAKGPRVLGALHSK
jgi:anhydro-N-acetylmuramic acid kinase